MIGKRIRQARLIAGMTQRELAEALEECGLAVSVREISSFESGKSSPSADILLYTASELDVPTTYLLHEPTATVTWQAFRKQSKLGKKRQEAIKAFASDRAELYLELIELLQPAQEFVFPGAIPVRTPEDAEKAASYLRKQWKLGGGPIESLVETLEEKGVIVIGWADDSGKFDGLSGWCDGYPVTVVNANRPADRIRFSLAHELGHLAMDTGGSGLEEEKLANRFAAALLVPKALAHQELGDNRAHIDWNEFKALKRTYGLSMLAWLLRARDLEIIDEGRFSDMIRDFSERGWRNREPVDYEVDECPSLLADMAQKAVAEGIVSIDRVASVAEELLPDETEEDRQSDYPDALELLEMDEDERDAWMERMHELANDMEFEQFEIYDMEEI